MLEWPFFIAFVILMLIVLVMGMTLREVYSSLSELRDRVEELEMERTYR